MSYSDKLRDPRWQKKRLKILERDKWKCTYCKDSETELQIHHDLYKGEPWDVEDKYLHTVCKHCHKSIEFIKKESGDKIINVQAAFKYCNPKNNLWSTLIITDKCAVLNGFSDDKDIEIFGCSRNTFDILSNFITGFYNGNF